MATREIYETTFDEDVQTDSNTNQCPECDGRVTTTAVETVCEVATQADVSAFGVIAIATINAVGGGAVADILLDRSPFILLEDFYASCAVLGGNTY